MSDFPRPNKSWNPNAYRSQAAYNAHLASLAKENQVKEEVPLKQQQAQMAQKSHRTQQPPSQEKDTGHDVHPSMTDAEVKQWYIDADREYEERKKVRILNRLRYLASSITPFFIARPQSRTPDH